VPNEYSLTVFPGEEGGKPEEREKGRAIPSALNLCEKKRGGGGGEEQSQGKKRGEGKENRTTIAT